MKKKKFEKEMSEGIEEPSLGTPYHEIFEIAMEGVCYGEDDSEYDLINLHATRKKNVWTHYLTSLEWCKSVVNIVHNFGIQIDEMVPKTWSYKRHHNITFQLLAAIDLQKSCNSTHSF